MKDDTKHALYLLAIFLMYGIAGRMDYDDQKAQEPAATQHMVAMKGAQP